MGIAATDMESLTRPTPTGWTSCIALYRFEAQVDGSLIRRRACLAVGLLLLPGECWIISPT